jgi:hypothetical protein
VGETVRRATGPWTPAVHSLLRHLQSIGFDGSPRVLGFDEKGREVLTYLHGEAGSMMPQPAYMWTDETLAAAARLVRRYHDAVGWFVPPPNAHWQTQTGAPLHDEPSNEIIICHNDLAPWNTIFRDESPYALIDWDFAAPGSRLWDVAYAVWRWVPVYSEWKCRVVGAELPDDYGPRARLFCDAYGLEDRSSLVEVMRLRMRVLSDTIRLRGEAGEPGFAELLRMGYDRLPLQDMEILDEHRAEIERALAP